MTEKRHIDPERAANRRRQVLDAAATCFRRSGFHGASMSEISKAAGMSAGHIYNYFASKDAIIAAFVEENETRVKGIISDIGNSDKRCAQFGPLYGREPALRDEFQQCAG